jgi:hypothetical protein
MESDRSPEQEEIVFMTFMGIVEPEWVILIDLILGLRWSNVVK